jgi:cyclopropane-fatty-acyl-phospholipid synthase
MTRTTTMADQLSRLLELTLGREPHLKVRAWDGSQSGPDGAPVVEVASRDAVRYLTHAPNELGLARAYVSGALGVDGDIYDVLSALPLDDVDSMRSRSFIPRQRALWHPTEQNI